MNNAQLQAFRDIAESMQTEPTDWQWIGPHMSQRMFGISRTRAEGYAKSHGGEAKPISTREDFARIRRTRSCYRCGAPPEHCECPDAYEQ